MSGKELDTLILKASEEADKMKNYMNKKEGKKYKDDTWAESEATFKAMLYHQLIKNGLEYWNISMENSLEAEDKKIASKRVDIWIDKMKVNYLLEVKMVGVNRKTKGLRRVNNKAGLYGDLIKLTELVKYKKNDGHTFGTAIAVYNGHNSTINCKYIESGLKDEVTSLLTRYVRLIICANGGCLYVKR